MLRRPVLVFAAVFIAVSGCQRDSGKAAGVQVRSRRADTSDTPASASLRASAQAALAEKYAKLERDGPQRFDQPQEAQEFYFHQRRPLDGDALPLAHLQQEFDALRAREAELARVRDPNSGPAGLRGWTALGPGNIGGRTRAIVISPVNPDVMYAAGVTGGVWKSTDAGVSWHPSGEFLPNLTMSALALDETDPNIVYAGAGEGMFASFGKHRGLGIYKTTDAGETWTLLDGTVNGVPEGAFYFVNKIRISPNNPSRIYAATMFGVWRSLDAGQTWSVVLRNPWAIAQPASVQETLGCSVGCSDLAVRTDRNPDVLFATFGNFYKDGLYRSDDAGDTWIQYTTGAEQGRMAFAIAPSNNERMYILMSQNQAGNLGRLYSLFRSDDGGANWASVLDFGHPFSEWLLSYVAIATGCYEHPVIYSQGWYDNIIAVDPLDPNTVWVGGIDLYRSDNGGQTFASPTTGSITPPIRSRQPMPTPTSTKSSSTRIMTA